MIHPYYMFTGAMFTLILLCLLGMTYALSCMASEMRIRNTLLRQKKNGKGISIERIL